MSIDHILRPRGGGGGGEKALRSSGTELRTVDRPGPKQIRIHGGRGQNDHCYTRRYGFSRHQAG